MPAIILGIIAYALLAGILILFKKRLSLEYILPLGLLSVSLLLMRELKIFTLGGFITLFHCRPV